MTFDIINLILLLAAAQGILLSFLIIHKHRKLFANYFLAALMLLLSITLIYLLLSELEWYKKHPFLMLIPIGLPFIANPLFYLYSKYLIQYKSNFNKKDLWHFLPFVIYEIIFIPDFFSSSEEIIALFDTITKQKLHPRFLIFNWIIIFQGVSYIISSLYLIRNYSFSLKKTFSNIEKLKLSWLRNIIIIAGLVWMVFIFENIMYLMDLKFYKIFDIASLFAALLVYSLGYIGLLKSEVFEDSSFIDSYLYSKKTNQDILNQKRYEKSGLTASKAKDYLQRLNDLMKQEKPFLDNNLTLNQLAKKLSISPHNLSEVFNTQVNQNFFDFINQYRVEQVKKDLVNPQKKNLTLLSIGLDAGFNSKSSFNAIFKKRTGKTPSEFRKDKSNQTK